MKRLQGMRHATRQILNGVRPISNRSKYMIICLGSAFAHLVFATVFGAVRLWGLCAYNAVVVVFYCFHAIVTTRKEKYRMLYLSALTEILFHSGMASILVGWEWRFMIYTIALIPLAFYLSYTLPGYERSIVSPTIFSSVIIAVYIIVHLICDRTTPLYAGRYPASLANAMSYFNAMIAFALLLFFSVLFSMEIRYMQKKLEDENHSLKKMAQLDPLTKLLNRRSMDASMEKVLKEIGGTGEIFCLLMIDIDDFKRVNDTYGHECGDLVLVTVSTMLKDSVRGCDSVCRWGGEEFLILVRADEKFTSYIADNICHKAAAKEICYKERTVRVTLTIGICAYQKGVSLQTMIDSADKKLYWGKNNGKNQVVL